MSAAKNFGLGHSEFPVTSTLTARIVFTDSQVQNPAIDAEAAAKHLETAAGLIRKEAAEAKKEVSKPK